MKQREGRPGQKKKSGPSGVSRRDDRAGRPPKPLTRPAATSEAAVPAAVVRPLMTRSGERPTERV
ncbi:class I SAM-dependent rRNA methyltransferase, partial [Rhizobium ruizarguesonis]